MATNLYAYTEAYAGLSESYPGFASLNRDDNGQHSLTVRSPGNGGRDVARVLLPQEELQRLRDALAEAPATGPRALYAFHWEVRKMGDVDGLFVADKAVVEAAIGRDVDFGEILGKHSEICGTLDAEDLEIKSEDQEFIAKLVALFGDSTISGYNPLSYLGEPEEDEEDGDEDDEEEGA